MEIALAIIAIIPSIATLIITSITNRRVRKQDEIISRIEKVELANGKNYLVQALAKIEMGQELTPVEKERFWENYDRYVEYIKRKYDIKSCCFAGHSLGEITSLVASGMLSFDDGMKLVKYRSRYMVEASSNVMGGMTSITQFSPELVTKFCEDFEGVWVSCYNSNHQTVIGGKIECLTKAEEKLLSMGAKVKRLSTIGAFHTPLMLEAANQLYEYIQKMLF